MPDVNRPYRVPPGPAALMGSSIKKINNCILSRSAQYFVIRTTFIKFFENIFCINIRMSAKIQRPHPYPLIGRPLLLYRATPTVL